MKNIYKIIALLFAVYFTACQDDNILNEQEQSANPGDEIIFNAISGYKMDTRSRTLYSGATYTEDGITYERIEWEVDKDIIGIYCETANNVQYADYKVTQLGDNSTPDKNHHAILARHGQNNGLQWNTGTHEFFAIYPSPTIPDQNSSTTSLIGKVKLEGNVLTGYVPTTQTPIGYVDNKTVTQTSNGSTTTLRTATKWAKPDMRYAYMIAKTTATPEIKHVDLSFKPISTALEIDINTANAKEQTISITNVTIQSRSGKPITGNFTCPIKEDGTPDTQNLKVSNTSSSLSIQLGNNGVSLTKGQTLRVTALLLPVGIEEGDLRITISGDTEFGGDQTGTLTEVSLQAHKKHYIANLPLKADPVTGNLWISRLDDDILLGGLSIPGAANAFSSAYTSSGSANYRTQSQSFTDLWNMGVRCFELVSNRPSNSSTSLGGQSLKCNGTALGNETISSAISSILNKLKEAPNEFAMVILTYQPEGGSPARDPSAYMNSLRTYYRNTFGQNDTNNLLEVYSPDKKVGDVRGKLMIVVRPSQEGEDEDDVVESAVAGTGYEMLTVKGWGSLMDKWWRRGYDAMIFKGGDSKGQQTDKREGYTTLPAMEDWIYGSRFTQRNSGDYNPYPQDARKTSDDRPTKGNIRYEYPTDKTGVRVWAQEWRRVFNWDDNYDTDLVEKNITGQITSSIKYDYLFPESFAEKKADVLATYERAINDVKREMVYFNSLDGFFVLDNNYKSFGPYWMGNMGDIHTYATNINQWFYETALIKAKENGTGTMGVIIMDYVGEDLGDIPGELLPQIIYNNNFKSALPTARPEEDDNDETDTEEGGEDEGGFGGGNEDE